MGNIWAIIKVYNVKKKEAQNCSTDVSTVLSEVYLLGFVSTFVLLSG